MNDLTIRDYQEAVDQWIQTIGIKYYSELTNTAILMEEVGELARLISREYGEQSWKKGSKPENPHEELAAEMADILFCLVCIANSTGVDLTEAVSANLVKKAIRDKDRHRSHLSEGNKPSV